MDAKCLACDGWGGCMVYPDAYSAPEWKECFRCKGTGINEEQVNGFKTQSIIDIYGRERVQELIQKGGPR